MKAARLFDSFLRIMGVLFCLALLVSGVAWCWPYGGALIWHLRNGNTAQIGVYQVPIPSWVQPRSENPLRFELRPGKFDFVDIQVGRQLTPGDKLKEHMEANTKSENPEFARMAKHFLATKRTTLMIADQPSLCIDDGLTIHCIPEHEERGLIVWFFGSRKGKPAFYETLAKIKRTTSK